MSVEEQLRAEADHCYRWSNQPGFEYAVHSHGYRKILCGTRVDHLHACRQAARSDARE